MSLTAKGKGTSSSKSSISDESIIIRRATLRDAPQIAHVAGKTYYNTPFTSWISPHREKYPAQYERGWVQRCMGRLLSPRNETYVACTTKGEIIGEAQFARVGDDAGARKMIRDLGVLKRVFIWVASWVFSTYFKLLFWMEGGDKTVDLEAVKAFAGWCEVDNEKHWKNHEDRVNRWHAQSVCVLAEWQGKGIGRRLMAEVMRKAQQDGVPVGLESSIDGEHFYDKLGFELISRFTQQPGLLGLEHGDEGGFMIWYPEGYKKVADRKL